MRDPEGLLVDVALGLPKPEDLTAEESDFWDRLEVQVREIKRRGGMVDIPSGLPEPSVSDGERGERWVFQPRYLPLSTLRVGVIREKKRPAKLPRSAPERRETLAAGAYRLVVGGKLRDVALYAFMRTLTEEGAVMLSRCPAPAPRDWSRSCGRYVIAGGRVGRPQEYCADACRVRAARKRESERGSS